MTERPTFSPIWHRVRAMRPRLRPHVQVTRQHYRGRRWHVVHDPASNQFYRLSPIGHEFVGLLDGRRTVEEVWNISLGKHGDAAPTQNEVVELLSQMYNTNLLALDAAPETEQLLRRGRERTKRRIAQQAIGIMYFRIRLFNPDRLIAWAEPILRPLLNRWGLVLWAAWLIAGVWAVAPEWEDLVSAETFRNALAPANWAWMGVVFVVIKAIHELGHGVLCRRFGGQVPEFGVMMLVLFPAPYVDASACWAFPSKWQRIAVGAGGMIFELAIAAGAAFVWRFANGSLATQLAYNVMLMAGVTTILFNANPLMRFDGYYILSDLLEVPNLMQRSMKMLGYLFQKHVYRIKEARPPSTIAGERATLVVYGVAALAYRIFLFFSITLYVMGQLFAIGLVLAVWTAAMWFVMPVGKFVHWLATSPQLAEFRPRAIATSLAMIAVAAVLLGAVPMPDHRRASGVVESLHRSGVFFGTDGFVVRAHARPGDAVKAGDPIVTCESPELDAAMLLAQAELAEMEALEREYTGRNPAAAQVVRERIAAQREWIALVERRRAMLVVRAPHDGVVAAGPRGEDPGAIVGAYAKRGQQLCEVVDPSRVRVVASMTTAQAAPLIELGEACTIQMRALADVDTVVDGRVARIEGGGQRRLPHAGLGYAGGGTIETDAQDRSGLLTRSPQFIVHIDPAGPLAGRVGAPGERVGLRLTLPSKPLLAQWIDRLHKLVQGRVDI